MNTYKFQNHEGREVETTLAGEPGHRVVEFAIRFREGLVSYGSVPLKDVMQDPWAPGGWSGALAPAGDIAGCADEDLVLLTLESMEALGAWAQAAALGRQESAFESVHG
jgi:hypothetical protein